MATEASYSFSSINSSDDSSPLPITARFRSNTTTTGDSSASSVFSSSSFSSSSSSSSSSQFSSSVLSAWEKGREVICGNVRYRRGRGNAAAVAVSSAEDDSLVEHSSTRVSPERSDISSTLSIFSDISDICCDETSFSSYSSSSSSSVSLEVMSNNSFSSSPSVFVSSSSSTSLSPTLLIPFSLNAAAAATTAPGSASGSSSSFSSSSSLPSSSVAAAAPDATDLCRPLLRGKIHLILLFLSPLWIFRILAPCSTWRSLTAASISLVSIFANFTASAMLHNFNWSPSVRCFVERLDHAGIFMMISGSTTPIPMLLLDSWIAMGLMIALWGATLYGIGSIFFGSLSKTARHRRAFVYVFIGLLHVLFITEYIKVLTSIELLLVMLLSALYISGAIIYAKKKPDPFPYIFGFHEIFHACCLGAALCTFYLDYSVLVRAGGMIMDMKKL